MSEYIPYQEEWENEVSKLTKKEIITGILRSVCIEKDILKAENQRLTEALLYYADYDTNIDGWGCYGNDVGTADGDKWEHDEGKIAQKALKEKDLKGK